MPGISRFKQAAAKYNVTTDFPHLGLHAAAATGNLGLVNYALSHGQPINSVLHGVLPLHAACSGGDELVVNLLIESGADVNAPRLPLRYTSDKHRDASAPIVGTSGSTPLHFACANGHSHIVLILLQHGAHPDRADKHGITPEVLARESGHDACADVVRSWVAQKDLDLRNRAEYAYNASQVPPATEERRRSFCTEGTKKRLVVKRSIDQALNLFKMSSATGASPSSVADDPPSPSPTSGPVEYGFPIDSPFDSDEVFPPRRPSLPLIYNNIPQLKSKSSSLRPGSAGSDDDQTSQSFSQGKTPSKYSLRNIFRKYSGEAPHTANTDSTPPIQYSASSSPTSTGRSSKYESTSRDASPQRFRSRLMSEGGIDSRPYGLSAAELHHKLSAEDVRSSSGLGTYEQVLDSSPTNSPATRPSILRVHNRSSSSGQRSSSRALRFDSSSTNSSTSFLRSSSPRRNEKSLNMKASNNSLKSNGTPTSSSSATTRERPVPDSALPLTSNFPDRGEGGGFESNGRSQTRINRVNELISEGRNSLDLTPSSGSTRSMSATKDFPFSINQPPPLEECECESVPWPECAEHRMRGNSVSSTYTDNSVDNPQLSSSCTTSGSASVSVVTPATHSSPLPLVTRVSSSASPGAQLDSFDGVSDKSNGAIDAATTPVKRHNVPIDIDISAISSHAQAEALVLRAQRSILEMDNEIYFSSSIGNGRSPLSAKLAAYGESLELERRLKQEEEDRASVSKPMNDSTNISPSRRHLGGHSYKLLDRQLSLDDKAKTQRAGVRKFRRPHTAGSTSESDSGDGRFTLPTEHQLPKSPLRVHVDLEPSNPKRELTSASEALEIVEISPTPVSGTPQGSHSDLTHLVCSLGPGECPSRSHTPDPPSEMFDSYQTVQGAPLSRVSTAPVEATFNDLLPRKSEREYSRQMTRTNKLAKMGFSSAESGQSSSSGTLRPASKARFSGLKSLVHSLKSK